MSINSEMVKIQGDTSQTMEYYAITDKKTGSSVFTGTDEKGHRIGLIE